MFSGGFAVDSSSYMCVFVCFKGDPGLPGPPGVLGPTVSCSVVIFLLLNHCTIHETIYYSGNKQCPISLHCSHNFSQY